MSAELERLAAEFEKFQARIKQAERTFGGVGDMRERLAELEAVATSPDRCVRVVAGAGGAVKDVQLTPDAMRLPSTTLAATIMSTLRAAGGPAVVEVAVRAGGIVSVARRPEPPVAGRSRSRWRESGLRTLHLRR